MEDNKSLLSEEADKEVPKNSMIEAHPYYQELTITNVNGSCPYGHTVGEKYRLSTQHSNGLCGMFYYTLHARLLSLSFGGSVPLEKEPYCFIGVCPEMGKVEAEIKRIENEKPHVLKKIPEMRNMTGMGLEGIDKYRVFIEILDIGRHCMWGHKAEDRFEIDPYNVGHACGLLWYSAFGFMNVLFGGGSLPWEFDPNIISNVCLCPDSSNETVYQLVREERTG